MKASVNERYGSPNVLEIRDVPVPSPGRGEIRVAVHATTVGRTDACALRAHPFFVRPVTGWRRPKRTILGLDFAGMVDAVGKDVTEFSQGERVFGLTPGGYGAHVGTGAYVPGMGPDPLAPLLDIAASYRTSNAKWGLKLLSATARELRLEWRDRLIQLSGPMR